MVADQSEEAVMFKIWVRAGVIGLVLVVALAASAGCSPAPRVPGPSGGAPATAAPDSASGGGPTPAFAWAFDDAGVPEVGDLELTMMGTWQQAEGAASLDGGTGHASSAAPGPVETTASFTVTVWVSLPPPRLLGQAAFATALSQKGRRLRRSISAPPMTVAGRSA